MWVHIKIGVNQIWSGGWPTTGHIQILKWRLLSNINPCETILLPIAYKMGYRYSVWYSTRSSNSSPITERLQAKNTAGLKLREAKRSIGHTFMNENLCTKIPRITTNGTSTLCVNQVDILFHRAELLPAMTIRWTLSLQLGSYVFAWRNFDVCLDFLSIV